MDTVSHGFPKESIKKEKGERREGNVMEGFLKNSEQAKDGLAISSCEIC